MVATALHPGAPVLIGTMTPIMLGQLGLAEEHQSLLEALNPRSSIVVPLRMRAHPFGVLTFAITESERHYTPADLDLAHELGQRAVLAIDHAQLYQTAQTAIQVRDQFLVIASHELRTPLTSVRGYSHLLQSRVAEEPVNTEAVARMAATISRQVERLDQLIRELLDVTRLQRGQFALALQPLDFAVVVTRVVNETTLALAASDSSSTIRLVVVGAAVPIHGDVFRLEAVVQNLINNAIKYRPTGGIVQVRVSRQNGDACLEVTDHGIGIPEEAQANLFEPFFRAGNVGSHTSGFGIGLYIVHEIIARHGGRITVRSTPGQGSAFAVPLPLRSSE